MTRTEAVAKLGRAGYAEVPHHGPITTVLMCRARDGKHFRISKTGATLEVEVEIDGEVVRKLDDHVLISDNRVAFDYLVKRAVSS